jgi:membrane associated rhomboid family serine protease
MSLDRDEPVETQREPVFNAPWPAVAVVLAIVGGYALQSLGPDRVTILRWGFSPIGSIATGHWETLVTAIFLHGGWPHALMNAAFGLAFATPVARFYGLTARGLLAFVLFYIGTGVIGNLGFGLIHSHEIGPVIGASGAISGLAAGASRIAAGRGRIGPITSPLVVGMGGGWIITNLLIAILGFAPGAGGATVAWEVHLIGFAAGLFLVKPLAGLANPAIAD